MDGLEQGLRIANLGLWFRGFCANLFQFRDTHLANVHIPIQEILLPVPLVLYNRWRRAAGLSSISQEFNLYTHRRAMHRAHGFRNEMILTPRRRRGRKRRSSSSNRCFISSGSSAAGRAVEPAKAGNDKERCFALVFESALTYSFLGLRPPSASGSLP